MPRSKFVEFNDFRPTQFINDITQMNDKIGYFLYDEGIEALYLRNNHESRLFHAICRDMKNNTNILHITSKWKRDTELELKNYPANTTKSLKSLIENSFIVESKCKNYILVNAYFAYKGKIEFRKRLRDFIDKSLFSSI